VTGSPSTVIVMITREIQLTAQIAGVPGREHFAVVETEIDGEVLVRTDYLGLAATYLELRGAYRGNVSVRLA
jgi:hypothetical protein